MIFEKQVFFWFQEEARKDTPALDAFCEAFRQGDPEAIERRFAAYLKKTIHIRDTAMRIALCVWRKDKKESFYHGILLGLLSHREDWPAGKTPAWYAWRCRKPDRLTKPVET